MKLIAFTVKGLEEIVACELVQKLGCSIVKIGEKIVIFELFDNYENLNTIKTADDIGVLISESSEIPKFDIAINFISSFRSQDQNLMPNSSKLTSLNNNFSITTSIAKTTVNQADLVEQIKNQISGYGFKFTEKDRSNLDFRIFVNAEVCLISIRISSKPLSSRDYEVGSYLGALKSTIASSMVYLCTKNLPKNTRIVDLFCGSGTILCESFIEGFEVFGSDISPEAVQLTRTRLKILGYRDLNNIRTSDATKSKWNSKFFDFGISNLPWDQKHQISRISELYSGVVREYRRILKEKFRLCIICHKPELLIKMIKKEFGTSSIQRIDLGYLGQNPSIVFVEVGYNDEQ